MPLVRCLCLSFLLPLLQVHSAEKPVQVGTLEPGESLKLLFTSGGCFHYFTVTLTLRRSDGPQVCCTVEGRTPSQEELELSAEDVTGLDALLEFYRSKPGGRCTTKDTLTVSRIRDGRAVAAEEFTDRSCALDEMKGVLSIHSLLGRFPEWRP